MRTAVGVLPATAAGILLLATPEVLRWSREIVMDVPAMAFLLLAAAAVLRYQSEQRTKSLLLAVLLLLAAIYTKQTAIFVVPAFALALVADDGWALARDRTVWVTAAGGVIGLLPIAIFTGTVRQRELSYRFWNRHRPKRLRPPVGAGPLAYGRALPDIVGIVPLVGSAGWLALVARKGWCGEAERRLAILMAGWFVIDYLLISVTADFETRYATPLTVPPIVLTTLLIARLPSKRLVGWVALTASMALFARADLDTTGHSGRGLRRCGPVCAGSRQTK